MISRGQMLMATEADVQPEHGSLGLEFADYPAADAASVRGQRAYRRLVGIELTAVVAGSVKRSDLATVEVLDTFRDEALSSQVKETSSIGGGT
jgi:hypothetical protein